MRRSVPKFMRPPAWWFAVLLTFCVVPSAFADAVCPTGGGSLGPCPGTALSGVPFVVPSLPVPEGLTQMLLPGGVVVAAGDVLVYDDPGMTILGDILRFPDIGGGIAMFVILLSDPGDPVDTGLPPPSGFQPNFFKMTENPGGPTLYTAMPSGQVYDILSDSETVPDVPEPATFTLIAVAGIGCLIQKRFRQPGLHRIVRGPHPGQSRWSHVHRRDIGPAREQLLNGT